MKNSVGMDTKFFILAQRKQAYYPNNQGVTFAKTLQEAERIQNEINATDLLHVSIFPYPHSWLYDYKSNYTSRISPISVKWFPIAHETFYPSGLPYSYFPPQLSRTIFLECVLLKEENNQWDFTKRTVLFGMYV